MWAFHIYSIALLISSVHGQTNMTVVDNQAYFMRLLLAVYHDDELLEGCGTYRCCLEIVIFRTNSSCFKNKNLLSSSGNTGNSEISEISEIPEVSEVSGNSSNGGNRGGRGSFQTEMEIEDNFFNFSGNGSYLVICKCGVFPACEIKYLGDNKWIISCNKMWVRLVISLGILLCLLVTSSNLLILLVSVKFKALRKPHGYFKLSLALSDLLAGAFVLPSIVYNTFIKLDWDPIVYSGLDLKPLISVDEINSTSAKFFGVIGVLSSITALYSLFFLSVDRFLSIAWPLRHRLGYIVTKKRAIGIVIGLWIFSCFVSFLPLLVKELVNYGMSRLTYQYIPIIKSLPSSTSDSTIIKRYAHALVYALLVWGIPFIVTWALTISTPCLSKTKLKTGSSIKGSKQNINRINKDLLKTVIIVLSLFTITILPVICVMLATIHVAPDQCLNQAMAFAFFFSTFFLFCGRFLNVIIYVVLNREFRSDCSKFLSNIKYWITCRRKAENGLKKQTLSSRISSSLSSGSRKSRASSKCFVASFKNTVLPTPSVFANKEPTKRSLSVPPSNHFKYNNRAVKLNARRTCSVSINIK